MPSPVKKSDTKDAIIMHMFCVREQAGALRLVSEWRFRSLEITIWIQYSLRTFI